MRKFLLLMSVAGAPAAFADQGLLQSHCGDCHGGNSAEGDFSLADLGDDVTEATVEAWIRGLDRVQALEMPPAEESRLGPRDRGRLTEFLSARIARYERDAAVEYTTSPRRLNNREFARSLADVLLINDVGTHEPLADLIGDTLSDGFDTDGDALGISEYHLEQYVTAVRRVLDAIILEGDRPVAQTINVPTKDLVVGTLQNRRRAERANRTETSIDILDLRNRVSFRTFPVVRVSGRYQIKIRATGVDRNYYPSEKTGIYEGDPIRLRIHLGGRPQDYDLPDKGVREIVIDEWLAAGTRVELSYPTDGLRLLGNGNFKFQYRIAHDDIRERDPKLYSRVVREEVPTARFRNKAPSHWSHWTEYWRGPRPRIYDAVVSGPHYESWPPRGTVALLGEAPSAADAAEILRPIATRAWRRDVTTDELEPIVALVQSQAASLGDVAALKEGLLAVLVSPSFLLINPQEETSADLFATKFSHLFGSTVPTEKLRRAVAAGKLDSFKAVRRELALWLADGRAGPFLAEFPYAWLQLDRINFMAPDPDKYPFYHRKSVSDDMVGEVRHFFRHAVENNVPVPELLLADYSFVNADLAKIYGLNGVEPDSTFRMYTFRDGRRGGLLGMGAFLTLTADSLGTSPIHRAIYVMENFLGIHPAAPPADVEITEPDVRSARTIKEVLDAHRSDESCAACHRAIDPFGYAFENFDPAGAWRDRYEPLSAKGKKAGKKSKKSGNPTDAGPIEMGVVIDASSSFPSGAEYQDIREFRRLLNTKTNRERFVRCFITKLLTYANGEEPKDQLAVQQIVRKSAESGHRIVDTIAAVVDSPLFREGGPRKAIP